MQQPISKIGGFLKSSFFTTLVFCNFIITIVFLVSIAAQSNVNNSKQKIEAIEENPLPQSISEESHQLAALPKNG
jgi:hypothetical protein